MSGMVGLNNNNANEPGLSTQSRDPIFVLEVIRNILQLHLLDTGGLNSVSQSHNLFGGIGRDSSKKYII